MKFSIRIVIFEQAIVFLVIHSHLTIFLVLRAHKIVCINKVITCIVRWVNINHLHFMQIACS